MKSKGWDKLIQKVTRIRNKVEGAPQRAAQAWLDEDFLPHAKGIAPRDTGEFADSIGGRVTKTRVTVTATAPHSRWVEEGTSKKPAQPTLGPALEATKGKLRERIKDEIRKATK
jgi:HK97 gp10 family phage protein